MTSFSFADSNACGPATASPVTALGLFSGGLDSILAARLVMEQGIHVHCLHFTSPFFGDAQAVPHWERMYGLKITAVDLGDTFVQLLHNGPAHGFGKVLNPCVDCKITMLRAARELMATYGASFVISGEVLGQRPMSQRRDTLNQIRKEAQADTWLLRPLSALHLDPTPMEKEGLVDRSRLKGFSGRGRKDQMELARYFGLTVIPTPAGGCKLTERENARRYWPVLGDPEADTQDFHLANVGRQVWSLADTSPAWLSVGRQQADNELLLKLARPDDVIFKIAGFPGPIALGRHGSCWPEALLVDAASYMASFSPKAVAAGDVVQVRMHMPDSEERVLSVTPNRTPAAGWGDYPIENVREHVRSVNRALDAAQKAPRASVRD